MFPMSGYPEYTGILKVSNIFCIVNIDNFAAIIIHFKQFNK